VRRTLPRDAGVALLVTLFVTVLIVTIVFEIFRAGARAAQTGAYGRDSIRAALLAEAGVSAARIALVQHAKDNDIDTLDDIWSREAPPIDFGDGVIRVAITDEERKLNLNELIMPRGNAPNDQKLAVFRRLLEILDIDLAVADAVVDWLDNDETTRVGGAESSYYESLPYPYRAKNDLFDTVEELRLVRGVTREVYDKLRPFVTVHSSGLVNINTAPKEVLMSLSAGSFAEAAGFIDEAAADEIIARRSRHPFETVDDLRNVSALFDELFTKTLFKNTITAKSTAFHVRSAGDVGGTVRVVDAVGVRSGNAIQWRFWRLE
jgi:general secretion pathway protein K